MNRKIKAFAAALLIGTSLVSVPASATSSKPETTSNTTPATEEMTIPEIKGTPLSKEETIKLFEESQKKMVSMDNYKVSGFTDMNLMENIKMKFNYEGVIDTKNADASLTTDIMGMKLNVFLYDGKLYFNDMENGTEEYVYMPMPVTPELMKVTYPVDERLGELFVSEKTDNGFVIKTDKELTYDGVAKVFPEAKFVRDFISALIDDAMKSVGGMDKNDLEAEKILSAIFEGIKGQMAIELNEDKSVKEMYIAYSLDFSKLAEALPEKDRKDIPKEKINVFYKYSFTDYNNAPEVKLPSEAENAESMFKKSMKTSPYTNPASTMPATTTDTKKN